CDHDLPARERSRAVRGGRRGRAGPLASRRTTAALLPAAWPVRAACHGRSVAGAPVWSTETPSCQPYPASGHSAWHTPCRATAPLRWPPLAATTLREGGRPPS